jgi:hypothetical protein
MRAHVMLASHGFYFDYEGKAARQKPGAPNPFIDSAELGRHIAENLLRGEATWNGRCKGPPDRSGQNDKGGQAGRRKSCPHSPTAATQLAASEHALPR